MAGQMIRQVDVERGGRLRRARMRAGLTQTVLASHVGVAGCYLSLIEAGKRPLRPALAERVEAVVGSLDADPAAELAALREMLATQVVTHRPCCSAHGEDMTCEKYRRTHFVEVGNCCDVDRAVSGEIVGPRTSVVVAPADGPNPGAVQVTRYPPSWADGIDPDD